MDVVSEESATIRCEINMPAHAKHSTHRSDYIDQLDELDSISEMVKFVGPDDLDYNISKLQDARASTQVITIA